MVQTVREVMTADPIAMPASASLVEAARTMRDGDIGGVIVLDSRESGKTRGIVTDRDIAIRGVAAGHDPNDVTLGDICSQDLVTLSPNDPVDRAVDLMKTKAIRRLPVVEDGKPVGIVSLGDLAVERDPGSALGAISASSPNQ
jgi:CBS domain-containing protein